MSIQTFGVDISAHWFDVAYAEEVRRFANTSVGISACLAWLATFGTAVRVGMEATGSYHLPLATALHAAGHTVLVCNPLSSARYSQAVLARTKTDATDARRIARFCEAHDVSPWTPASPAQQRLRALVTARETLVQEALRLRNRQPAAGYTATAALVTDPQAPVLAAIEAQLTSSDGELARLAAADTPLGAHLRLPPQHAWPGARHGGHPAGQPAPGPPRDAPAGGRLRRPLSARAHLRLVYERMTNRGPPPRAGP
jgi:transposase